MKIKKTVLCLLLCAALGAAALAAGGTEDRWYPFPTWRGPSAIPWTGRLSSVWTLQTPPSVPDPEAAAQPTSPLPGRSSGSSAGDCLTGSIGTSVLVLAGNVQVNVSSGTVVDVSAGTTVSSGATLSTGHRYMAAEDTMAQFVVTGKTAVVDYQGPYALSYSGETDYNAMASALKTLHLFQGSLTGYGQGYDLEAAPTRLQALIMFIRVLGEEEQALAWSGTTPFTDIQPGLPGGTLRGLCVQQGLYQRIQRHTI